MIAYPDPEIRLAVSRAVAIEQSRGWKLTKEKTSHRIDIVVAMAMAALAAVQQGERPMIIIGCQDGSALYTDGQGGWIRKWGNDEPRIRIEFISEKDDLRRRGLL